MKLTNEQYQETLKSLTTFHKLILGDPYPLSPNQALIMSAISTHMETIAVAGSKGGKSTISAEASLWSVYRMLHVPNVYRKYGLNHGMFIYSMNIAPKEDVALDIVLQYIKSFAYDSWYLRDFIEKDKRKEMWFKAITDEGEEVTIIARAQGSSSKAGGVVPES